MVWTCDEKAAYQISKSQPHDVHKKYTNIIDTEIVKVNDGEQYISKFLKRKLAIYNYQTK